MELPIALKRFDRVFDSLSQAILALDKTNHSYGQPILIEYKTTTGVINTLLAVGISKGIGRSNYRIFTTGHSCVVHKVKVAGLNQSPAVEHLADNQIVIWYAKAESDDNQSKVYKLYLNKGGELVCDLVIKEEKVFCESDGYFYYVYPNSVRREDQNEVIKSLKSDISEYENKTVWPMINVTNVKEALDVLVDYVFPKTPWSLSESSVNQVDFGLDSNYYKTIHIFNNSVVANYEFTIKRGYDTRSDIRECWINGQNLLVSDENYEFIEPDTYRFSGQLKMFELFDNSIDFIKKDEWGRFYYEYDLSEHQITKDLEVTVITTTSSESTKIGQITYSIAKGTYESCEPWSRYFTGLSIEPSDSKLIGQETTVTASWPSVSSITKTEAGGEVVTFTPQVEFSRAGNVTEDRTFTLQQTTVFKLKVSTQGSTTDSLGNRPASCEYTKTITFEAGTFWFSGEKEYQGLPEEINIYQTNFRFDGNGKYLYILAPTKTRDFKMKAVGSDDKYLTTGLALVSEDTITIPSGHFDGQVVNIDNYYLYRTVNNVTVPQIIRG